MHRILVIQTAFIGDVVLATALLQNLHAAYPAAKIDILVRQGADELFTDHPYINEVHVWNKKKNKYQHLFQIIQNIRRIKYDVVINVQRYLATGIITVLSGAKKTIGFDKNPLSFLFSEVVAHQFGAAAEAGGGAAEARARGAEQNSNSAYLHETSRNHALLASLTTAPVAKPALYPSAANFAAVQKWQSAPYICMSPGSVWETKKMPAQNWIDLINAVPTNYTIYLMGAPNETTLCAEILSGSSRGGVINIAGQLNLLEAAALIKGARLNYVNDSAPMHLASATNAPVAAIYCSTIPAFGYGPLSSLQFIVETLEHLPCKPCGLHGKKACPLGHFNCGYKITTAQLLAPLSLI
ncbi:MAG: glycosyltransferase family 9 protein [Sediminibacterium sp.]